MNQDQKNAIAFRQELEKKGIDNTHLGKLLADHLQALPNLDDAQRVEAYNRWSKDLLADEMDIMALGFGLTVLGMDSDSIVAFLQNITEQRNINKENANKLQQTLVNMRLTGDEVGKLIDEHYAKQTFSDEKARQEAAAVMKGRLVLDEIDTINFCFILYIIGLDFEEIKTIVGEKNMPERMPLEQFHQRETGNLNTPATLELQPTHHLEVPFGPEGYLMAWHLYQGLVHQGASMELADGTFVDPSVLNSVLTGPDGFGDFMSTKFVIVIPHSEPIATKVKEHAELRQRAAEAHVALEDAQARYNELTEQLHKLEYGNTSALPFETQQVKREPSSMFSGIINFPTKAQRRRSLARLPVDEVFAEIGRRGRHAFSEIYGITPEEFEAFDKAHEAGVRYLVTDNGRSGRTGWPVVEGDGFFGHLAWEKRNGDGSKTVVNRDPELADISDEESKRLMASYLNIQAQTTPAFDPAKAEQAAQVQEAITDAQREEEVTIYLQTPDKRGWAELEESDEIRQQIENTSAEIHNGDVVFDEHNRTLGIIAKAAIVAYVMGAKVNILSYCRLGVTSEPITDNAAFGMPAVSEYVSADGYEVTSTANVTDAILGNRDNVKQLLNFMEVGFDVKPAAKDVRSVKETVAAVPPVPGPLEDVGGILTSIVWGTKLDNKYDVYVERKDGDTHTGVLKVDLEGTNLFSKDVTISYGGPFGPDAGDVNDWSNLAAEFVDNQEK